MFACRRQLTDLMRWTVQSEERLPMKFSKLGETVSKKPLPSHVKHLIVEVMVTDEEGEDVEVPFIVVRI